MDDFEKMNGLAPSVVQEAATGEVLMLGFMNREALAETLRSGDVTSYSRSRQKLWKKGETTGNTLRLAKSVKTLARCGGLEAHARAVEVRR